jgi:hypothetical protein
MWRLHNCLLQTCSHEAIKRGYKGYEAYKDLQYRGMICKKKGEAIIEEKAPECCSLSTIKLDSSSEGRTPSIQQSEHTSIRKEQRVRLAALPAVVVVVQPPFL